MNSSSVEVTPMSEICISLVFILYLRAKSLNHWLLWLVNIWLRETFRGKLDNMKLEAQKK
jgi:hypothetical protein